MYNSKSKLEGDWRQIHSEVCAAPEQRNAILQRHGAKLNSFYTACSRFGLEQPKRDSKKATTNGYRNGFREFNAVGSEPIIVKIPGCDLEIRIPAGDTASLITLVKLYQEAPR